MKRKAPYNSWFWGEYEKGKVSPEILQAIGHLSFLWNDVEEALDRAVAWAMELPIPLQVEVRSRINGLDGKIEIVKARIRTHDYLLADAKKAFLETLGAFQGFKERRDAVMHAKASEIRKGVARTFERRGTVYEVLITEDALNALNAQLEVYNVEIAALAGGIGTMTPHGRTLSKVLNSKEHTGPDAEKLRQAGQAYQWYLTKLLDCQRQRKALRPPPELPAEVPMQWLKEAARQQPTLRSGGSPKRDQKS